ncbi:MAG: malonyl-CoA decarboxylase domain-containing protein, partial [Betaproteobacteria bacterium]
AAVGGADSGAMTEGAWWDDPARRKATRAPLLRLVATYLTQPNTGPGGIDPVARFHLGNGARLERINWLGNPSERGMRESHGVMVNYLYDRDAIEANHEAFVRSGQVARGAEVERLLDAKRATASRRTLARLLGSDEKPPRRNG